MGSRVRIISAFIINTIHVNCLGFPRFVGFFRSGIVVVPRAADSASWWGSRHLFCGVGSRNFEGQGGSGYPSASKILYVKPWSLHGASVVARRDWLGSADRAVIILREGERASQRVVGKGKHHSRLPYLILSPPTLIREFSALKS